MENYAATAYASYAEIYDLLEEEEIALLRRECETQGLAGFYAFCSEQSAEIQKILQATPAALRKRASLRADAPYRRLLLFAAYHKAWQG